MTPAEIIYQRRIAVLDHAQPTGNVAEACRTFGISRTRYYEWKGLADRYGLDALMPKAQADPPDARGHPHPRGRRAAHPGRPRAHHRLSPVRRPSRRTGASRSPSRPCKRSWSPTVWGGGPSGWPGRPPSRRPPPGF